MVIGVHPPWKMYFNGVVHRGGAGAGVIFVTSQCEVLPYSFTLTQLCSNNVVEYLALIFGLEMAVEIKQLQLKENKKADVLAALASSLTLPDQAQVSLLQKWVVSLPNEGESEENELEHLVAVSEAEKEELRQPIIDYLSYRILSENMRRRTEIRHRAPRFLYYKDTLYRRSFERVLLRCLGEDEALQALQEAHFRVCGSQQSGPKLHFHIKRMGYYWSTMVKDIFDNAQRCKACQFHAKFIHQPLEVLHPTVASWPFAYEDPLLLLINL
ncbi:uncharacterized protein [Nicotiana tomentosiformis]|uniref:uncharacterized protein n=1 Tax=Nicotiana tomentosiformis TaxID=4098 RepID=UPI00388CA68A